MTTTYRIFSLVEIVMLIWLLFMFICNGPIFWISLLIMGGYKLLIKIQTHQTLNPEMHIRPFYKKGFLFLFSVSMIIRLAVGVLYTIMYNESYNVIYLISSGLIPIAVLSAGILVIIYLIEIYIMVFYSIGVHLLRGIK